MSAPLGDVAAVQKEWVTPPDEAELRNRAWKRIFAIQATALLECEYFIDRLTPELIAEKRESVLAMVQRALVEPPADPEVMQPVDARPMSVGQNHQEWLKRVAFFACMVTQYPDFDDGDPDPAKPMLEVARAVQAEANQLRGLLLKPMATEPVPGGFLGTVETHPNYIAGFKAGQATGRKDAPKVVPNTQAPGDEELAVRIAFESTNGISEKSLLEYWFRKGYRWPKAEKAVRGMGCCHVRPQS